MLKALFALVAAAMFASTMLYVVLAEHPARMRLDDRAALAQWQASQARGPALQAGFALLSLLLGAWAWWKIGDLWLLAGALLVGAAILFTLVAVVPVSRRLGALAADAAGPESRALLVRWGRLHLAHAVLGLAAVAAYFAAILWP